jgi:fumarate reductase subunit D
MKRSGQPVFWVLFGAGGMLSALFGPALVFITGIAVPLGVLLPQGFMNYSRMLSFAQHWAGKAFLLGAITLFIWHAAHRIFHSLHDLGLHTGVVARTLCYGGAGVVTLLAVWSLSAVGL